MSCSYSSVKARPTCKISREQKYTYILKEIQQDLVIHVVDASPVLKEHLEMYRGRCRFMCSFIFSEDRLLFACSFRCRCRGEMS